MCDSVEKDVSVSSSPAIKSDTAGHNKRKKGRKTPCDRVDSGSARLHASDSHMRLNFLHQAAVHFSYQSSGIDDGYAKLARRYTKLFRDVLKTERVKVMPDIIQTFCRKCKQMFLAKVMRSELTLVQCKVIQSKCILCGYKRNYEWNMGHLSRNQKYWTNGDGQT
ncbi:hypothetical protein KIN20_028766 [Parelaphostrongylus tenuis]|uniref:RNAse P Rpr2/Rpp21 subunit domain protein n=1 Tax=Parelaphostrongylus tenuis TaxID=148309 RepID=A0AAD5WF26_PARTN|nr:hypothetical protein KIN20_028766 [Parelaphostrongylus tenuis]